MGRRIIDEALVILAQCVHDARRANNPPLTSGPKVAPANAKQLAERIATIRDAADILHKGLVEGGDEALNRPDTRKRKRS